MAPNSIPGKCSNPSSELKMYFFFVAQKLRHIILNEEWWPIHKSILLFCCVRSARENGAFYGLCAIDVISAISANGHMQYPAKLINNYDWNGPRCTRKTIKHDKNQCQKCPTAPELLPIPYWHNMPACIVCAFEWPIVSGFHSAASFPARPVQHANKFGKCQNNRNSTSYHAIVFVCGAYSFHYLVFGRQQQARHIMHGTLPGQSMWTGHWRKSRWLRALWHIMLCVEVIMDCSFAISCHSCTDGSCCCLATHCYRWHNINATFLAEPHCVCGARQANIQGLHTSKNSTHKRSTGIKLSTP